MFRPREWNLSCNNVPNEVVAADWSTQPQGALAQQAAHDPCAADRRAEQAAPQRPGNALHGQTESAPNQLETSADLRRETQRPPGLLQIVQLRGGARGVRGSRARALREACTRGSFARMAPQRVLGGGRGVDRTRPPRVAQGWLRRGCLVEEGAWTGCACTRGSFARMTPQRHSAAP